MVKQKKKWMEILTIDQMNKLDRSWLQFNGSLFMWRQTGIYI